MAIEKADIAVFLRLAEKYPVLDVRSPGEYDHAHIPGARSFPLFTDEERKVVGTLYKQQSREAAIKAGLDIFAPKMRRMVEEAEAIVQPATAGQELQSRCFLVHCWRGGMRSAAIAWLLDLYGFKIYTLNGGYKKFRRHVLEAFRLPLRLRVLGGYTGSGKTEVLRFLRQAEEAVIDLEAIAGHRGSAFGDLGKPPQPSQEMFENLLAMELRRISALPETDALWLEDESQRIGLVNIPPDLWRQMRKAPVVFLDIPFEERLSYLVKEYGAFDHEMLAAAILRIQKRLGGQETKNALRALQEDHTRECFRILLRYYDKWYRRALENREDPEPCVHILKSDKIEPERLARDCKPLKCKISNVKHEM